MRSVVCRKHRFNPVAFHSDLREPTGWWSMLIVLVVTPAFDSTAASDAATVFAANVDLREPAARLLQQPFCRRHLALPSIFTPTHHAVACGQPTCMNQSHVNKGKVGRGRLRPRIASSAHCLPGDSYCARKGPSTLTELNEPSGTSGVSPPPVCQHFRPPARVKAQVSLQPVLTWLKSMVSWPDDEDRSAAPELGLP